MNLDAYLTYFWLGGHACAAAGDGTGAGGMEDAHGIDKTMQPRVYGREGKKERRKYVLKGVLLLCPFLSPWHLSSKYFIFSSERLS